MFNLKTIALILSASLLIAGCGGRGSSSRPPAVNTPPTLGAVADQSTDANITSDPINVTVSDTQTSSDALTVTAVSDNQGVVADTGLTLSGSGGTRTLEIQPVNNQIGNARITLTVTDAGGLMSTTSFAFTVNALNLSFQQFVRAAFADNANATPRSVNIAIFSQDAGNDDFADLINP